jgi:nicotinamide-nucleotide amidase
VLAAACRREIRLATAESCTGGLLASLLTDVPGCSHAFDRGFVTYTNLAKQQQLGVPAELLATHGAVSEAVAAAMAQGAVSRSEADIAIAITGWADAGPEPGQEAGLIWFGCAGPYTRLACRKAALGNIGRAGVRVACLAIGLEMLREALE